MKTKQFIVKLLSDVILNQKSASKGSQQTLDFIPGANFMGIVASSYDHFNTADQMLLFHSSKVRFGDAHPILNNLRSLRTPLSFSKPKNSESEIYVHHTIQDFKSLMSLQLQQQRKGFLAFEDKKATRISQDFSFAIKSAYDREKRRSMDSQMFGYQSMVEGSEFCFELHCDDIVSDATVQVITNLLIGNKRVGRSRTAQYGLVEIKESNFDKPVSNIKMNGDLVIYAESRLIFFDQYGNSGVSPKIEDFGCTKGEINWEKSQIRTFGYTPWNFKRSCFDVERKGIEKGSVVVIENAELNKTDEFVGAYQNEGFGKVIFNPNFFVSQDNGQSTLEFCDAINIGFNNMNLKSTLNLEDSDSKVFNFLKTNKNQITQEKKVYELVNEFVEKNGNKFSGDSFASQWGTIRSLALRFPLKEALEIELFTKKIRKGDKEIPFAYLTHGVAKTKWEEKGRIEAFKLFFNRVEPNMTQYAVINLASEMAKKQKGKTKYE